MDLYIGEKTTGPILHGAKGARMDRYAADRAVKRLAWRAGIASGSARTASGTRSLLAALDAGVALRDVQEATSHADPRTTMRYDRGRGSLDRHATYIVATFLAGASR
jgi:integrase